jgi:HAAS
MSQPSSIIAYLDELARELAFDPALARRVCHEVHDHLRETVDAASGETAADAERRAIVRFGRPREIAAQYRTLAICTRMRRAGVIVILAVAGIFLAMEGRVAWYGLVQWPVSSELQALGSALLPVDRYAFLAAALLAITGWVRSLSLPIPADHRLMPHARVRRCQHLAAAATIAVAVAVTVELCLTGLRLLETGFSSSALLPAGSVMLELGLVAGVAVYLGKTRRRLDRCTADR